MNNPKKIIFIAGALMLSGFAYIRCAHKNIPSDLRDAMGDGFSTSLDLNMGSDSAVTVNAPAPPPPKNALFRSCPSSAGPRRQLTAQENKAARLTIDEMLALEIAKTKPWDNLDDKYQQDRDALLRQNWKKYMRWTLKAKNKKRRNWRA